MLFLSTLQLPYNVFENEYVACNIQRKWDSYANGIFFRHIFLDIAMVLAMYIDAFTHKSIASKENLITKLVGYMLMVITLCL